MILGSLALKLSLLCAVVGLYAAIRWARGSLASERLFRAAYHAMTACLALASIHLLVAIFRHDFRFEYVIGYTSRDLPPLYLLSALWAGQSGTLLVWAFLAALVGYALFRKSAFEPAATMVAYVPTVGVLLVLMLAPSGDPFRLVAEAPPDGRGLNPLLQDPWMASHPPLVFLGYAAMAAPWALALAAAWRRREQDWLPSGVVWSLVAFVSLGGGIILGGIWAYRVLGWGGYWGWDPVENASLVPWIAVTALLHGLVTQRATRALPRTNLALALTGYLLVLYATFLTRSGVLADVSVHSFPAGDILRLLVVVLASAAALALVALFRSRRVRGTSVATELAWPFALSSGVVALVVCGAIVLVGTSWPILSALVGKTAAPTAAFYNRATGPIALVLLGLLSIAPLLAWVRRPLRELAPRLVPILAAAVAITILAALTVGRGLLPLALLFVAVAALLANAVRFVEVVRSGIGRTGASVAHLGFALMFAGIVGSSAWGVSERATLPLGVPTEVLGRTLEFTGHVLGSSPQDRWGVVVRDPGGSVDATEVAVFRAFVGGQPQEFHRPGILRGALQDLYIAPGGIETVGGAEAMQLERGVAQPVGEGSLTFTGFETHASTSDSMTVIANVLLRKGGSDTAIALPLSAREGRLEPVPVEVAELGGARLVLERMSVEEHWVRVRIESDRAPTQVLSIEASTKPLVALVWLGTLAMLAGCSIAIVYHLRGARVVEAARGGIEALRALPTSAVSSPRARCARIRNPAG